MTTQILEKYIYPLVDDLNSATGQKIILSKSPTTFLYGGSSALDSLGLVNFIVGLEERIHDEIGVEISIVSERAMSQKQSPFRTLGSLAEFIDVLIKEKTRQ